MAVVSGVNSAKQFLVTYLKTLLHFKMSTGNSPSGIVFPSPSPLGKIFAVPVPVKGRGGHYLPIPEPERGIHPRRGPRPCTRQQRRDAACKGGRRSLGRGHATAWIAPRPWSASAPRTLAAAGVAGAGDSRTGRLGLQVSIYTEATDRPNWCESYACNTVYS